MTKRLIILFSCVIAIFTILYVRVSDIALGDELQTTAAKQSTIILSLPPTRGQIYDTKLIPLVDCTSSYFIPQMEGGKPTLKPATEGFSVTNRYAKNQLAQHVIGYISDNVGVTGIEKLYNTLLLNRSTSTVLEYRADGLGNPLQGVPPSVSLAPPVTGGVVLTIDKRIQEVVEEIGGAMIKKGAIVVLDPYSGKIRAAASFPQYNANNVETAMKDANSPLINRCYSAYNVGSIFKLVTAATALEDAISPRSTYVCTGEITLGDVTFGCHRKQGHGEVDMNEAINVSCNPYFINLSTKLDKQKFLNMARDLSFGRNGSLPTVESLKNIGDVANLSFGQGALTATPIEVAALMSSIINDGNTILPTIVEGTTGDGKNIASAQESYPLKAMHRNTASQLKSMMISAVMDTPSQNAKPTYVSAGGKTSTAQTGQFVEGEELLCGWFSGFFPAKNPRFVVAVVVEDVVNGNNDASPVFKAIADRLS